MSPGVDSPLVSITIPTYSMQGKGLYFLERLLKSIELQSFDDYEVVVTDDSTDDRIQNFCLQVQGLRYFKNEKRLGMAKNTNRGINEAKGEIIKILYQDDYFAHRHALRDLVKHMTPSFMWLATSCVHSPDGVHWFAEHHPFYSRDANTIGSPSVIMFRKEVLERFDERMSWVLDLDFYKRMFKKYGLPKIANQVNVVIGIGPHQTTYLLSDEDKNKEYELLKK